MSNKPPKRGDKKAVENELRAKASRKSRLTGAVEEFPPYTMIFCEGTKTEPHYLREIVNCIMARYKRYAMDNHIKMSKVVQIDGIGRSNKSLLEYARNEVSVGIEVVWLVYDKDDFPAEYFDVTPDMATAETKKGKRKYYTAWSNQCVELWFLLHFQPLDSDITRDQYMEKLIEHYPAYTKASTDVYTNLKSRTPTAIERAKELHRTYDQGMTPSEMAPCTKVYELVEFLLKYC